MKNSCGVRKLTLDQGRRRDRRRQKETATAGAGMLRVSSAKTAEHKEQEVEE